MPFLILKAHPNEMPGDSTGKVDVPSAAPGQQADAEPETITHDRPDRVPEPVAELEPDIRLGAADRFDEARRFADMGKSMRLVDPERPHEAHLVGPDLADPTTWRHTLLVDDQPFTDREFDQAEDAFLSALRAGAVPASGSEAGHEQATAFDLDEPFVAED